MRERLLKRINKWEVSNPSIKHELDSTELSVSIRDDLEKIFNTRRGTVLIDESFGLPDFSHMMNGYSAPDLEQIVSSLQDQTRRYEKRLTAVEVKHEQIKSGDSQFVFLLNASMRYKQQEIPFSVNVSLGDDGSATLS